MPCCVCQAVLYYAGGRLDVPAVRRTISVPDVLCHFVPCCAVLCYPRGRLEMQNFIMPVVGHTISLTRIVTDPTSRDNPDRQPGVLGDNLREVGECLRSQINSRVGPIGYPLGEKHCWQTCNKQGCSGKTWHAAWQLTWHLGLLAQAAGACHTACIQVRADV